MDFIVFIYMLTLITFESQSRSCHNGTTQQSWKLSSLWSRHWQSMSVCTRGETPESFQEFRNLNSWWCEVTDASGGFWGRQSRRQKNPSKAQIPWVSKNTLLKAMWVSHQESWWNLFITVLFKEALLWLCFQYVQVLLLCRIKAHYPVRCIPWTKSLSCGICQVYDSSQSLRALPERHVFCTFTVCARLCSAGRKLGWLSCGQDNLL